MKIFRMFFIIEYLFLCRGTSDLVLRSVLLKIFIGNVPSDCNENVFKEINNFSV